MRKYKATELIKGNIYEDTGGFYRYDGMNTTFGIHEFTEMQYNETTGNFEETQNGMIRYNSELFFE